MAVAVPTGPSEPESTSSAAPRAGARPRARHAVRLALALGLAASLPVLAVGFSNDDLLQQLELEGRIPGYPHPWFTLYDFTPPGWTVHRLSELGYLPWFSSPELSLRFFRPLSSALLSADHFAFGRHALGGHLHSLAWFAVLVGTTAALYRRWLSRPIATWAAVIYATAGLHAMATAWIAARHSMVSSAFAVLALWSHARTREDGWRAGPLVTASALVAGLAAGETGLGAFAFLAAYELWRTVPWKERARGVAPFAAAALAYVSLYTLAGYGTHHSRMYISPLVEPRAYAAVAPVRLALLAGQLLDALPSELPTIAPRLAVPVATLGIAACAGIGLVLYRLRAELHADDRRHLGWLSAAGSTSLLPMASTMPGGRLLPLALVGTAPLVGAALVLLARVRPRWRAWPALGVLGLLHLVISPAWRVVQALSFEQFGRGQRSLALNAELDRCREGAAAYLVTGSDPSLSLYAGPALLFYTPERAHGRWFKLSSAPLDQRLTRTGPQTIELEVEGKRFGNQFERLYSDRGVRAGDRVHFDGLDATVLAADDGLFTRARFELIGDLDAGTSCILAWRGAKLVAISPPPIGQSLIVRHEPGPMGL